MFQLTSNIFGYKFWCNIIHCMKVYGYHAFFAHYHILSNDFCFES